MGDFPKLADYKGDICGVKAEEAASVVLGHAVDEGLDAVLGDLGHSAVLQVEDGRPGLNATGNHSVLDDILQKEGGQSDEAVHSDPRVNHSARVDDNDGSHVFVAAQAIDHTQLQVLAVCVEVEV